MGRGQQEEHAHDLEREVLTVKITRRYKLSPQMEFPSTTHRADS
jgi:hypothetical protein